MPKKLARLTQDQLDVLLWIREGCPSGVYENGYEHRIRARTLERRGLVEVRGQGSSWRATITEAGRAWRQGSAPPSMPSESAADELIRRVIAANGRLVLPADRAIEEEHQRLVRVSMNSALRPKGKKLEMVSTGSWSWMSPKAIVFTEHFDDYVEPSPVPVPERVREYHPVVKAFLADRDWQMVTAEHVPRAGRILQAIASEAQRREIDVISPADATRGLGRYEAGRMARAHLGLKTPAGNYVMQIREIPGRGGQKIRPNRHGGRKTRPSWLEYRQSDFVSTGRLELLVWGPGISHDGDRYHDLKTISVEGRLPAIFRFFEIHKLRADWEEEQRQRKAADRRLQWEAAMAQARLRYVEHARWEHFKECSRTWQEVNEHRRFLVAARRSADSHSDPGRDALVEQLEHAERRLGELDPIAHPELIVPTIPDPKPKDLEPFLEGWSPLGPDGRSRS